MQAFFDHLASVVVSSAVMLIFAYLQYSGTVNATEQTYNYMVVSEAFHINNLLERDLENLLTESQTRSAIDAGNYTGAGKGFTCILDVVDNRVISLTFPTVGFPEQTLNAVDPREAEVIEVTYSLHETGDSLYVSGPGPAQHMPLFELYRIVDGDTTASSKPYITNFMVRFARKNSKVLEPAKTIPFTSTACNNDLYSVRFEFDLALEGASAADRDHRSTNRHNVSKFATTINLTNWE